MNGVHDMGGLQGMGPVQYEHDEPVFHAKWEGRIYALTRAMRALRKWHLDADRYALEVMPPVDYLRMSYFERWVVRLETQVVKFGLVTAAELKSGKAASKSARGKAGSHAGNVVSLAEPRHRLERRSVCPAAVSRGRSSTRPQHESPWPYPPPALRARQGGNHQAGLRCVQLPRHQRSIPG